MLHNRFFGNYVRNYIERRGIKLRIKIITLVLLWATIISSAIFATDALWLRILLMVIASAVTVHIILIKTLRE